MLVVEARDGQRDDIRFVVLEPAPSGPVDAIEVSGFYVRGRFARVAESRGKAAIQAWLAFAPA